ncbi:MAG: hypothetical protein JW765_01875 [Deltaproteobacteria bacterium]|nr:hypothetical protein [Candidatus Zymogenaceae bacterium]
MDSQAPYHTDCSACGTDGFIIRQYNTAPDGGLRALLIMDERTEGWIGIPHGGFGMGAIMELLSLSPSFPDDPARVFPISADFRMGGAQVVVGDTVRLAVSAADGAGTGVIEKEGQPYPYISGEITCKKDDPAGRETLSSYLPANFADIADRLLALPYYMKCFVCGVGRDEPGLRRQFRLVDGPGDRLVVSLIGFDPADKDTVCRFHRRKNLHPICLLALGDETMGWGAFFLSQNGGVSVRLSYTFYREIGIDERVVVFGRGERVKGDIAKRMMFWASGGAAVVKPDGTFEIVMTSSGQWLAIPALTEQMRQNLIPAELTREAFSIAQGRPAAPRPT